LLPFYHECRKKAIIIFKLSFPHKKDIKVAEVSFLIIVLLQAALHPGALCAAALQKPALIFFPALLKLLPRSAGQFKPKKRGRENTYCRMICNNIVNIA
jgi:hypothetical protein